MKLRFTARNLSIAVCLAATAATLKGQIVLTGTSYNQNFDTIGTAFGTGATAGWTAYEIPKSAFALGLLTSVGVAQTFHTTQTAWNTPFQVVGGVTKDSDFGNCASVQAIYPGAGFPTAPPQNANPPNQNTQTDRTPGIGLRASDASTIGGSALAVQFSNPQQFTSFSVTVDYMSMRNYNAGRPGNFSLELFAGIGAIDNSNPLVQFKSATAPATVGWNTTAPIALDLSLWKGKTGPLTLEFVVVAESQLGEPVRMGIDNLHLNFTAVPEPEQYALLAGLGLVGWGVWRRRAQT